MDNTKSSTSKIIIIVIVLIIGCCCIMAILGGIFLALGYNPTPLPLPSTSVPRSTPSDFIDATSVPQSTKVIPTEVMSTPQSETQGQSGNLIKTFSFDDESDYMDMWPILNENGIETSKFPSSYYVYISKTTKTVFINYYGADYENSLTEMNLSDYSTSEDAIYTLTCRFQSPEKYYMMGVSMGRPFIAKRVDDDPEHTIILIDSEIPLNHDLFAQGNDFKLTSICDGDKLSLLINDTLVYQVTDTKYTHGDVGTMFGSIDNTNDIFVTVNDFSVSELKNH